METKQPKWKMVAQLGDVNWIEEGGLFVYQDETGEYPPEMTRVRPTTRGWEIRRVVLSPCTFTDGLLSDNKAHPECSAWFSTSLGSVARFIGQSLDELVLWFLSSDPCLRARAWEAVGDYYGWDNLDSYPMLLTERAKLEEMFSHETLEPSSCLS